jgi:LCP family protein required for cell wall assembly
VADRTAHIDQTLSRLTAIHAGLSDDVTDRVSGSTRLPQAEPAGRRSRSNSRHRDVPNRSDELGRDGGPDRGRLGSLRIGRRTKLIALAVAAVLLVVAGAGFGANLWLNGKLRTIDALSPTGPGVLDAAAQSGDQNYLFVIADPTDRQAPESNVSNGVETVLLAHVPAGRDRAVLLSVPANLVVNRPGCERYDAASASYQGDPLPAQSKVVLASAYHDGGPRCIVAQIQQLTGLSITHFMSLDLASVRDLVNAENGLATCVPRPVVDDSLGTVVPNGGKQMLGGEAALSYARAWHVRGEADGAGQLTGQALRQQLLLSALLDKVDTAPLMHLPTLGSVAGVLGANSLVDGVTLGSLGQLSEVLRRTDPAKVDFVGVPTAGQPDAQGNEVLSADAATVLFTSMRTDRPLPGEGASAPAQATADAVNTTGLPPSQVTVTVRNGSSHSGLANGAANSLRSLGFRIAGVGDAAHSPDGSTIINASSDQSAQAAALSRAVLDAQVKTVSGAGTLELVLGDSFDGQVSAAPAAVPAGPALLTAAQVACH